MFPEYGMVLGKHLQVILTGSHYHLLVVQTGALPQHPEVPLEVAVVACIGWKVPLLVPGPWTHQKHLSHLPVLM